MLNISMIKMALRSKRIRMEQLASKKESHLSHLAEQTPYPLTLILLESKKVVLKWVRNYKQSLHLDKIVHY